MAGTDRAVQKSRAGRPIGSLNARRVIETRLRDGAAVDKRGGAAISRERGVHVNVRFGWRGRTVYMSYVPLRKCVQRTREMTAHDQMRAMLDQLMGTGRNGTYVISRFSRRSRDSRSERGDHSAGPKIEIEIAAILVNNTPYPSIYNLST